MFVCSMRGMTVGLTDLFSFCRTNLCRDVDKDFLALLSTILHASTSACRKIAKLQGTELQFALQTVMWA